MKMQLKLPLTSKLEYSNNRADTDILNKFSAMKQLQSILEDMASRAAYREEVEEGALIQFRREQLWKRAFDRLRFFAQWSRYEKRIKRIQEK